MAEDRPACLLYLLSVGKEKELALRVHGEAPSEEEISSWMRDGTVTSLRVSREGEQETFALVVNFTHVVVARLAPYSESRLASF